MLETRYISLANEITERIDKKEWSKKLPGVGSLAKKFSADPKTINKAVRFLETQKRVKVIPKSGTWIVA